MRSLGRKLRELFERQEGGENSGEGFNRLAGSRKKVLGRRCMKMTQPDQEKRLPGGNDKDGLVSLRGGRGH